MSNRTREIVFYFFLTIVVVYLSAKFGYMFLG